MEGIDIQAEELRRPAKREAFHSTRRRESAEETRS
jgi:hypothetical protein